MVAGKALDVTAVNVADMRQATRSGQTSDILASTVKVYGSVARYLNTKRDSDNGKENMEALENMQRLKLKLKGNAGRFCDKLTSDSAPGAAPLSSVYSDFFFSCQKVEQRIDRSRSAQDSNQAL